MEKILEMEKTSEEKLDFKLYEYLPFQLFTISALMCKELSQIYGRHEVENNKEWRVMAILNELGTVQMSVLSRESFIDPVNLTRTVENLFQKGFCDRNYDRKDRRKVELVMAPKGREAMNRLIPELIEWERKFTAILGEEASAGIKGDFDRILKVLSKDNRPKIN